MSCYDNFLVIGDLSSEVSEMVVSEFCKRYNLWWGKTRITSYELPVAVTSY